MIRSGRPGAARVAAAVLALSAAWLAGCSSPAAPGPLPTPSQSTEATTPPGRHYESIDNLCDHVSLDAINAVMPHVEEDLYPTADDQIGLVGCSAVLGNDVTDDMGVFSVDLTIYEDESAARADFDYFHDDAVAEGTAVDLDGLGQLAFQYLLTLGDTGDPYITVLDGNALITCSWVTSYDQEPPPAESIFPALEESLRHTLASLGSA